MASAIIAVQRAKRRQEVAAEASGFLTEQTATAPHLSVAEALEANKDRLYILFDLWDEDRNGQLNEREFRRALTQLGIRPTMAAFHNFLQEADFDGDGMISLEDIELLLEARREEAERQRRQSTTVATKVHTLRTAAARLQAFVNLDSVQTVLYVCAVVVFQLLVESLRVQHEFFLDDALKRTFLDNDFNEHHVDFSDIRRPSDVWNWGNQVLWPGLLGNAGPSCWPIGPPGVFNSWADGAQPADASGAARVSGPTGAGCNDHAWADGDEHASGAQGLETAFSMAELVDRTNRLDWTAGGVGGVVLYQRRAAPTSAVQGCRSHAYADRCLPDLDVIAPTALDTAAFGYNWTAPGRPLSHPFRHYSAADLGADPSGRVSFHQASNAPPDVSSSGAFISAVVPFFSETMLPEERGTPAALTNLTRHRVTVANGKRPNFSCVRLVWSGDHAHQLCDPNIASPSGVVRTSGVVRAAIAEFWNDLKRAHWIDTATRSLTIALPITANNAGVQARLDFHLELTASGAVLPSHGVQTRVVRTDKLAATRLYINLSAAFTLFFLILEIAELVQGPGLAEYFSNLWNTMDWLNFLAFGASYVSLTTYLQQSENPSCDAYLCTQLGVRDDWQVMSTAHSAKLSLALCVTIQLLKLIKFTSALVPKMGLAPLVLKRALPDLVFFVAVFFIVLLAFSQLFYVGLGPHMVAYVDQQASLISLGRALFGDFDIGEILGNSPGYTMTVLFLAFLFISVFILLSMFFAILGESQANLRDDQRDDRKEAEKKGEELPPEYGIIAGAGDMARRGLAWVFPDFSRKLDESIRQKSEEEKHRRPSAVDRVEARQL